MYYGERIRLRRVDPETDLEDRVRWMNDPEVLRYLGMLPGRLGREEIRRWLEESAAGELDSVEFAIETLDGRHIGGGSLREFHQTARKAELALLIGETEFRGKGYGTEAVRLLVQVGFEQFNLNRIWLTVNEQNLAAIRAYEKAGFRKEGLLRAFGFANGAYYNVYLMAILREEYEMQKGSV